MIKSTDITRQSLIDLSPAIATHNALDTPLTTMLMALAINGEHKDRFIKKRVKTLPVSASGQRLEGSDAPSAIAASYSYVDNNMEIFSESVSISGTASAILGGRKAELKRATKDAMNVVKNSIESKLFTGVKADEEAGVSGRAMNGFLNQVVEAHVIDADKKGLTKAHINAAMKKLKQAQAVGQRYLFVNSEDIEEVAALYENSSNVQINLTPESATVGLNVRKVITVFGELNLVIADACPANSMLLMTFDDVELLYLRKPQFEELAKTGDSDQAQVVTELTVIAPPVALAKIVNFHPEG